MGEDKLIRTEVVLKDRLKTHPDGGYGWLVVFSAFSIQFITVGLQNSSGTIFPALIKAYGESKGETAWVASLGIGVMFLCGPLTTTLCEKYGCRIVACVGSFLSVFGLVMSSFAQSLQVMYVTYGITWGLGASLCYFPTLIILVQYFDKRLALVNGFVSSGSGLGTLVISPFAQFVLSKMGLFNSLRIFAIINALNFICALSFKPVSEDYARLQAQQFPKSKGNGKNKGRRDENSLWRHKAYIAWVIALSTFMLGYFVPFVHLKRHAVLLGVSDGRASFLIGILSITSTIGKVFAGKIADMKQVNVLYMEKIGLLTMSISTTLLPMGRGYTALVVYALVFGLAEAIFVVLIPLVTKEIVGISRLSPALGSLFMIMAIPTMLGPPVSGWIYDLSGSYSVAFYVAGGFMAAGVCLLFFIPFCSEDTSPARDPREMLIVSEEPENDFTPTADKLEKISEESSNGNTFIVVANNRNTNQQQHQSSVLMKTKSRSRLCIIPCLPPHGHLGVEEGSSCNENNDADIHEVEKISVI
eukprot:gene11335-12521_t